MANIISVQNIVYDTYLYYREANMLSQALDKDTVFKVNMHIPPSLLSPMVCTSYICSVYGVAM